MGWITRLAIQAPKPPMDLEIQSFHAIQIVQNGSKGVIFYDKTPQYFSSGYDESRAMV